MKIINPATDEVIKEIQEDNIDSIAKKFEKAKVAQVDWKKTDLEYRVACIQKFGELLKKNLENLASDLTAETGKPLQESKNEVNGAAFKLSFFIEESKRHLQATQVHDDGTTTEVIAYDPLGVITNISAWNYPYLVGVNIFIPALITGNAVLYKPSEFALLTGQNITKLLHEAGIPEFVFQMIVGAKEAGEALLELPLDGYFFTGSYQTGKHIATKVAPKLVPVGLELGGKDPLYITDEVDVKSAAENALEGAFYNNGQSCCSVERIYVHEKIYDEFESHFINKAEELKAGDPLDNSNTQGAITRKQHLDFLEGQVKDAIDKGANLVVGGKRIEGKGSFFMPTVLTNVTHEMSVMKDESFGPIIGLMKVKDDNEAISLMNDTEFGLTSAVFTKNQKRGEAILEQINSGTGYLNCCDRVSGYLPWSGRGHSGVGSTLSKHGLYAFVQPKGYHFR
jgi:acyl-CoA reductase-like NAD-dependent aldehyde dehydrogenase